MLKWRLVGALAAVARCDILVHRGEPITPPTVAPARGPLLWEWPSARQREIDAQAQPEPDYAFDQRNAEKNPHGDAQQLRVLVGSPASNRDTFPLQMWPRVFGPVPSPAACFSRS